MPTKQQTFDTVVSHLRKQGKRALSDYGKCAYRGRDGTMCAAGCLIPDDKYERSFEGASVFGIANLFTELGHDLALISELQSIHDGEFPRDWEDHFEDVALTHGLTYTPTVAPPEPTP